MTQQEKQLLMVDLCARLPYMDDLKVARYIERNGAINDFRPSFSFNIEILNIFMRNPEFIIKPYLRPMSSMTEEECLELSKLKPNYDKVEAWKYIKTPVPLVIANIEQFDFFHSHHLDWRDLIPMGLALKAPEGMYK